MRLEAWQATLRAAAQPVDLVALHDGARRIAERAQELTGYQTSFRVATTPTGARISAVPPSPRAQRALDRAVDEQMDKIRGALATQGRERLQGG